MSDFYCYLWLREKDGTFPVETPYYVGKGYGNRAFTSQGHCVRCPKDSANILIIPMTCEDEALEYEMQIIEMFGRADQGTGCLRNHTDGGEGISGFRHTDASKAKIKAAWQDPKHRQYMSAVHKGPKPERSLNYCQNISAAKKGKDNGLLGRHSRWHVNRAVVKDDCSLCQEKAA